MGHLETCSACKQSYWKKDLFDRVKESLAPLGITAVNYQWVVRTQVSMLICKDGSYHSIEASVDPSFPESAKETLDDLLAGELIKSALAT
jgi:hypothetical protein